MSFGLGWRQLFYTAAGLLAAVIGVIDMAVRFLDWPDGPARRLDDRFSIPCHRRGADVIAAAVYKRMDARGAVTQPAG